MIEPLRLSFDVQAPADHAFSVWTERIDRWWPADHTQTGSGNLEIVLEGHVVGALEDPATNGQEWDWGRIQIWEPPQRFVYSWHLKRTSEEASEVEIRFVPLSDDATRVEIEHRGWERLGAEGGSWRDRNRGGWETLLPHYVGAVQAA